MTDPKKKKNPKKDDKAAKIVAQDCWCGSGSPCDDHANFDGGEGEPIYDGFRHIQN